MKVDIQLAPFVTHTMPLTEINKAFDLMHEGTSIRRVIHYREETFMSISIHPVVDRGIAKGADGFTGGTLRRLCAQDPVEAKVNSQVYSMEPVAIRNAGRRT